MCVADLMTNKPLQEVLYMVLVAGNFLNSVCNSVCFNMVTVVFWAVTLWCWVSGLWHVKNSSAYNDWHLWRW